MDDHIEIKIVLVLKINNKSTQIRKINPYLVIFYKTFKNDVLNKKI